jgi:hypothetical protein
MGVDPVMGTVGEKARRGEGVRGACTAPGAVAVLNGVSRAIFLTSAILLAGCRSACSAARSSTIRW